MKVNVDEKNRILQLHKQVLFEQRFRTSTWNDAKNYLDIVGVEIRKDLGNPHRTLVENSSSAIPAKPSPSRLMVDKQNILTPAQQQAIEAKVVNHDNATSNQIAVVIVPTTGNYDISDMAFQLGRTWGVGNKQFNNGIVFLIAINDRKVFIATGYGLEGAVPDITASRIVRNVIVPNFERGDYYRGINDGVDALIKATAGERTAPKGYKYRGYGGGSFGGGGAGDSWTPVFYQPDDIKKENTDELQIFINDIWCSTVDGKITSNKYKNTRKELQTWDKFVQKYKPTPEQLEIAKKSCKNNKTNNQQKKTNTTNTAKKTNNTKQVKKINWIKEKFPLKFMMRGPNIQRMQEKLMIKNTGNFYTMTEKTVARKMDMLDMKYDRNTGIDETTYNKIMNSETVMPSREKIDISYQKPNITNLPNPLNLPITQNPEEFYNALLKYKVIIKDGNRIKLKNRVGENNVNLNDEQFALLNQALTNMGYRLEKQRIKEYGIKYVWVKQ